MEGLQACLPEQYEVLCRTLRLPVTLCPQMCIVIGPDVSTAQAHHERFHGAAYLAVRYGFQLDGEEMINIDAKLHQFNPIRRCAPLAKRPAYIIGGTNTSCICGIYMGH